MGHGFHCYFTHLGPQKSHLSPNPDATSTLSTKPHAVAATNQHGAFRRRDSTSVLSGQI